MPAPAEVTPSLPVVPAPTASGATVQPRYSTARSDSTATDIEEDLEYSDSFESIDAAAPSSAPAPGRGPTPPAPAAALSTKPQDSKALPQIQNNVAPKEIPSPAPLMAAPAPSLPEAAQPPAPPPAAERAASPPHSTPPPSTSTSTPDPPIKTPGDARIVTFGSPIDPVGATNESAAAVTGRLASNAAPSARPPSPAASSTTPLPADAPSPPFPTAAAVSAPRDALVLTLTEPSAAAAPQAPQPAPPLPERPPETTTPSTTSAPSMPSAPTASSSASAAMLPADVPALQPSAESIQPGVPPAPPPPAAAAALSPSPQQPPSPSTVDASPVLNPPKAVQPAPPVSAPVAADSAALQPQPPPPAPLSDPPALSSPSPPQPPAAPPAQPSQQPESALVSSAAAAATPAPEPAATSAVAGAPAPLERPATGQPGQAAASAPPGKQMVSTATPKTAAGVSSTCSVAAPPPPPPVQPTRAPPPPFLVKPLQGILLAQRALESELQGMARVVAEHGLSDILAQPTLVPVPGGHHGLSSKFLDENLEAWLRAAHPSGLHWRDALPLLLSLSDALVRLHKAKIHHRNIKPSNVFVAQLDASVRQRGPVFAAASAAAASEFLPIPAAPLSLSDPLLASLQDPKVFRPAPGTMFQGQEWWAPEQLTNQCGTDPPPRSAAAAAGGGAAIAAGDEDRLIHFPTDSIDFTFEKGPAAQGAASPAPLGPPSDSAARTDSFGWGAVALFALTGRHPMGSDKVEGIFKAHANATTWAQEAAPAPSSGPDGLPAPLRALIAACLSRDPDARPDAASIQSQLVGIWKGTYRSQSQAQAQSQALERLKDSVSIAAPPPAPEARPESDAAPPPSVVGHAPPPGDRFEIARLGGGAVLGLAMGPLPWRRSAAHLVAGLNEPRRGVTVWAFGAQGKGSLVETLSEIKTYYDDDTKKAVVRHVSDVTCAVFHPTRVEVLAVGDTGGMVGVWDWPEETMITMHKRHGHHCNTVSFHPSDPDWLGIGYSHGLALIWNWKEGGAPVELRGHNDWVTSLAFSPNRPNVVLTAGKMDRTARLWDFKLRRVLQVFEGNTGWVRSVCFHPSEPNIIAIGSGGFVESGGSRVRVWDTVKKECVSDMTLPGNGEGCSLAFHPARPDLLAAGGSRDNTAKLLNWRRQSVEFSIEHPSEVETVAFSPRSPYLLGVGGGSEGGGSIRLYMLGM